MSNIYSTLQIPSEEDEVAMTELNGFVFKHPAKICRIKHLWPPKPDDPETPPEWEELVAAYLANFTEPVKNLASQIHCFACNALLTGPYGMEDWRTRGAISVDLTSETKEGRCTSCGYPLRTNHKVSLPDGRTLIHLVGFPLLYHPRSTARERAH